MKLQDKWDAFLRNPKQMTAAMLLLFGISTSFLWNTWEADGWEEAVVFAAISLLTIFGAGQLLGRIEKFFSPRPLLWLTKRERELFMDIADHKACGAPHIRDGELFVCMVPPHTTGVNHIGMRVLDFKVLSDDHSVAGSETSFEVLTEEDDR